MENQLNNLGSEIDVAIEESDVLALNALIDRCNKALESTDFQNRAIIHFFKANCYSALAGMQSGEPDYMWSWQQNDKVLEILSLRRAVSEPEFSNLDPIFQCKILTNLGSSLDQFGRFIEAIQAWDSALAIVPNFAMALGNKGVGVIYYAQSLYDHGHAGILFAHAKGDLKESISEGALWDSGLHPEAEKYFRQNYNGAEDYLEKIDYDFKFDLDQWPIGVNKKDVAYRTWCLRHGLFLSPLNDVCRKSASARDVLHLPSHTYKINEEPRFPNYYNILKQEYVTARFMLFESSGKESEHISDHDVLLLNGFDGVQFGYRSEQLKTAYRLAYSLFDKIALFLNEYYEVGLKTSAVSFRSIWGQIKNKKFELYHCFEGSKNWPLRGLYYLSKDLFDDDFVDVSLPEAKELAGLRNRIEHRYLSLQECATPVKNTDTHSYITIDDFQLKTMRIMSMAREALIYLSLAMHREEEIRHKESDKLSLPIQSMPIERFHE
ncbi:MAG: LA2681 family HEPN domain-containing protein [Desulfocapsaceae bacterium]|nr:LA2681 family HEPN domain-containing protein [Desulfocapsaceae bacterium]